MLFPETARPFLGPFLTCIYTGRLTEITEGPSSAATHLTCGQNEAQGLRVRASPKNKAAPSPVSLGQQGQSGALGAAGEGAESRRGVRHLPPQLPLLPHVLVWELDLALRSLKARAAEAGAAAGGTPPSLASRFCGEAGGRGPGVGTGAGDLVGQGHSCLVSSAMGQSGAWETPSPHWASPCPPSSWGLPCLCFSQTGSP